MAIFNLNLQRDITPKTSLTIPGDGKVVVEITGDIDVPEPLLAQQIWDAAKEVVDGGKKTLKKRFKEGAEAGWTEAQITSCIAEVMEEIGAKAKKAVSKTVKALAKTEETYSIVKKQDVGMAAKSGTKFALSITRLVISGGTDIAAWGSLVSNLVSSAKYLYKALVDIEKMDKSTRKSVGKAEVYYRGKFLKGQATTWDKFVTFFSDPLSNAKTATTDMEKRLARAEKPCHDMAKVIQGLLELQDAGNSDPKVEAKLNNLIIQVSNTMGKVGPASKSLGKMSTSLKKLEKDVKSFKNKGKVKVDDSMIKNVSSKIGAECKKLKKYADDNAVGDWCSAAKNTYDLAQELAGLM